MSTLLPNFYLIAKKKYRGKTVPDSLLPAFILSLSKRFVLSLFLRED